MRSVCNEICSHKGIAHNNRPWQSVQFHTEARCGPLDRYFLFHEYLRIVGNTQSRHLTTIQYKHPRQLSKVLVLGSGGLTIGQASPT